MTAFRASHCSGPDYSCFDQRCSGSGPDCSDPCLCSDPDFGSHCSDPAGSSSTATRSWFVPTRNRPAEREQVQERKPTTNRFSAFDGQFSLCVLSFK